MLAAGAGLIVSTLACAGLSGAAPAPEPGRIAFIDDQGEVRTVSTTGAAGRRVTGDGLSKLSPSWSPDAQRIAYITQAGEDDDVFVVKRDGGGLGRVTRGANPYTVSWSPDGMRLLLSLASVRGRAGMAHVRLNELPRAKLRRFAGSRHRLALGYSPDGSSLAFEEGGSIFVARIRGNRLVGVRRIAGGRYARWIGRGSALAILQDDAVRAFSLTGGRPSLLLPDAGSVSVFDLDFGRRQVVFDYPVERGGSGVSHVFVARVGSSDRRDITGARLSAQEPSWRPECTITGTAGADRIIGTAGSDVICALDGNDTIRAGASDDTVIGGEGNDSISGGGGRDFLFGGAGRDSLESRGGGRDVVDGGPGVDSVAADGPVIDTVRNRG